MLKLRIFLVLLLCAAGVCADETPSSLQPDTMGSLIMLLGGASWEVREGAQQKIISMGSTNTEAVLDRLLPVYAHSPDPEVRFRSYQIMEDLVSHHVFREKKGFLGVSLQQNPTPRVIDGKEVYTVLIMQVLPDNAAIQNGIRAGEEIVSIDGHLCHRDSFNLQDLINYISSRKPGTKVKIDLLSNNERITKVVPLGERPLQRGDPPIEVQRKMFFKQWLDSHMRTLPGT